MNINNMFGVGLCYNKQLQFAETLLCKAHICIKEKKTEISVSVK